MLVIDGLNPSVVFPSHQYCADTTAGAALLLCPKVIAREDWSELVEDGVVGALSLTFVLSLDVLIAKGFSEEFQLLVEAVLRDYLGELEAAACFVSLACKDVVDNSATEAYYGGSAAIGVLHAVYVLCGFYAFLFEPVFNGFPEAGNVYYSVCASKEFDGLLNSFFVCFGALLELDKP